MSIDPTSINSDSSGNDAAEAESADTPIASLLSLPQSDDAGAQTADRYDWQAAMASADALALHFQFLNGEYAGIESSQIQIICEYHEDWIVRVGTQAELVSAKHRDPQVGPWRTAAELVDKGGLGHLFSRWLNADRRPSARLVTNAATAAGPAEHIARCRERLERQASGVELTEREVKQCEEAIDEFCLSVMKYVREIPRSWRAPREARIKDLTVPADLLDAGAQLLRTLRIDQQRPSRVHVAHTAPSMFAVPTAKKLGADASLAAPIWDTVLTLLRIRMRARGESERRGLPIVGRAQRLSLEDELRDERTVSIGDIEIAIATCIRHPKAYSEIMGPRRLTKLSMKMARGDCADTSIERAEQLRLDYSRYRRERKNAAPGNAADLRKIEAILHRIADEETEAVRTSQTAWGSLLWGGLSSRLNGAPHELTGYGIEGELSLGGVCQLAQECKVWFSGRFNVSDAIKWAKLEKAAGVGS